MNQFSIYYTQLHGRVYSVCCSLYLLLFIAIICILSQIMPCHVWCFFLPPQTEFFLYFRLISQFCLSLVVFTYLGKDSFAWVNTLLRHKQYNDVTSWLTQLAPFSKQKAFWSSFWKQKVGFVMRIESGRRKIINHDFVQGQGNPPSCQRFATSTTRQASSWTANLWHSGGFSCHCTKSW